MNEEQFKFNFISTFCAAWCAQNHADSCLMGTQERLETPPMEDAIYLADCAWGEWLKYKRK